MTIAIFAEGSDGVTPSRVAPYLYQIWCQQLPAYLSLLDIKRVVPISKKAILALDPNQPPMSGAGEPLDDLLVRENKEKPFDVAVVAWDLAPPWDKNASTCRWNETLDFYKYLVAREKLPQPWFGYAKRRYLDLSSRVKPSSRDALPSLEKGAILPICMEPEFERLLVESEKHIRMSLGVQNKHAPRWPNWDIDERGQGNTDLLQKAILSARRMKAGSKKSKASPKSSASIVRQIRGDMITAKDEWGSFFLRAICDDEGGKQKLLSLPLARRLSDLLAKSRCDKV
ncbi:MAG TPA: hypothetical protein VNO30_48910 [Kofleriaceae bacterium]|nr:hypothetical protein [Kofleriaceae bacterium]